MAEVLMKRALEEAEAVSRSARVDWRRRDILCVMVYVSVDLLAVDGKRFVVRMMSTITHICEEHIAGCCTALQRDKPLSVDCESEAEFRLRIAGLTISFKKRLLELFSEGNSTFLADFRA